MWSDGGRSLAGSRMMMVDEQMEEQVNGKRAPPTAATTAGERMGSTLSINYPPPYQQMNQFGTPSMHSLCSTVAPSTIIEQQAQRLHENFIIDDYMQKIDTKVELLENELKFAWRALDLLTTEYSKMAQRLDKIDKLAGDQQLVVQNLINLTLHNDATAYEDMLANSERYESFRRKVLQEAAAASLNMGQPSSASAYRLGESDLEFDGEGMALENYGGLNVEGLETIPDLEENAASLYDILGTAATHKADIPIYYSNNPFRDANVFAGDDMEMNAARGDEEQQLLASLRQQQHAMDNIESDNFEHFKNKLETMKRDVYANSESSSSSAAAQRKAMASNLEGNNVQSYLKEFLMAQRVGEGLEEGVDPIADFGHELRSMHAADRDPGGGGSSDGGGGGGSKSARPSKKMNRSQHKKLIASEMEMLNNQLLQRRQLNGGGGGSNKSGDLKKAEDQKKVELVDVVARIINERYEHIKTVDGSLVSNETLATLHNETYLLMRIFFFFYMRYTAESGERDRCAMLWKFIGQVLGGVVSAISELDDAAIAVLNNHIQMTIEMLKTLSAVDFQEHLQQQLDDVKRQPAGPIGANASDFDIEAFFCKGSSPKFSISTLEDFELQIEKEDEPKALTSSSCYQFELIKQRYDMEEQKRKDNPSRLSSSTINMTTAANPQQDHNENIYANDEYIQSLKRNLERHSSMLYLLHLQGQEKDKCGLEDDKNKLILDMMMDKLLENQQTTEAGPRPATALVVADVDEDEMNPSNSPPPPAPIAPFLCREQDDDSEDGIEYDDDYIADDVAFARMMMAEGNMNVDDFLSRSHRGGGEPLQFDTWNDFAPECDQNAAFGYSYPLGNGHPTGKVVHSKPKASRSNYNLQEQPHQGPPPPPKPSHLHHPPQQQQQQKQKQQYVAYDATEVDSNLKYLEQMGRSQPICSPFENHSRFASPSASSSQQMHNQAQRVSQLTGPPDLLKLYLEQQHSSATRRSVTPQPTPPPRPPQPSSVHHRSQSAQLEMAAGPPLAQRLPRSEPVGMPHEKGASSKKRKFQMVVKLQNWLHDQSSSSGNESRSADGHGGSWMKRKHFRFRSQSLSEPMRSDRDSEISDQESSEGGGGGRYAGGGRRRSFMKTMKKEIGKRVRKIIVKDGMSIPSLVDHPDLAAAPLDHRRFENQPGPAGNPFETISRRAPPVSVRVSEPLETDDMGDLFLKVGDHTKPASPVARMEGAAAHSVMSPQQQQQQQHQQLLTQGNPKSASLSSSNSATSSGGESGGASGGGLGVANAQNSGPNAFIFNNSTSMEFAASRKVGKYRKGKRGSSSEGHSDTAESGNNLNNSVENNETPLKVADRDESAAAAAYEDSNPFTEAVVVVAEPITSTGHSYKNALHFPHIQKVNSICIDEIPDSPTKVFEEFASNSLETEDSPVLTTKAPTTSSSPSVHGPANVTLLSTNWGSVSVDEDSRSQHSYRTIASGGTSRRQSTEDSIDTDDEYFCYELRKLEEMEREAHDISFLKDSGRLPQFEFEDSSAMEEPCPAFARTNRDDDDPSNIVVDDEVRELFKNVVHPQLKAASKACIARKLHFLRTFEETRAPPTKRRDGSGLNFLLRSDEGERRSCIKFYHKELRYLDNPLSGEFEEEEEEEEEYDDDERELSDNDIKPRDEDEAEVRSRSGSSAGSSSTTSGPESNPDVFSDFEEELEEQDKLRDEYQHRDEGGDQQFSPGEVDVKSPLDESLLSGKAETQAGAHKADGSSGAGSAGGAGASKWKLLKTLKDRKAEEKTNQEKIKEEETQKDTKNKVSVGIDLRLYSRYCCFSSVSSPIVNLIDQLILELFTHLQNGNGSGDGSGRNNGHPSDNPFYSNIDSMPDIRPRRKSIPLVSELVRDHHRLYYVPCVPPIHEPNSLPPF